MFNPFQKRKFVFKGNLHCHSTASDGSLEPLDVLKAYARCGYDFVAISDHCKRTRIGSRGRGACLAIPAEEIGNYHVVALNSRREIGKLQQGRCLRESVRVIRKEGGFPIVAHPHWSGIRMEDLAAEKGTFAIEVYNFITQELNGKGYALERWDELLNCGKRVWGVAADDAHFDPPSRCPENLEKSKHARGWVMVNADSLSVRAISEAIAAGNFYSTQGPLILSIETTGRKIKVRTSKVRNIKFICNGARGRVLRPARGFLEEAEYEFPLRHGGGYVRIECEDDRNRTAWSNPVFISGKPR